MAAVFRYRNNFFELGILAQNLNEKKINGQEEATGSAFRALFIDFWTKTLLFSPSQK